LIGRIAIRAVIYGLLLQTVKVKVFHLVLVQRIPTLDYVKACMGYAHCHISLDVDKIILSKNFILGIQGQLLTSIDKTCATL
jgi:hypothetical protein